jgi:Toprim-like/Protein of unknown function (DUF3991)
LIVEGARRQDLLDQWRRDLDAYKREINLVEYAIGCGYELRKKESYRAARVLKHSGDNHKIVVARDATDNHWVYFSIHPGNEAVRGRGFARNVDNGTIVDFILSRERGRFDMKQVHEHCRRWLGRPDPLPARPEHDVLPSHPSERDRLAVALRYQAAQVTPSHTYLQERGLSTQTLQHPRFRDSWRQDARGNALFVHRDAEGISGYEVKNRNFTGFASGGIKSVWHSAARAGDKALVVAESAIDAMSFHQLHPRSDARYMSIGGMPTDAQLALLTRAAAKMLPGSIIVSAVDADRGGDLLHGVLEGCMAQPHVHVVRRSPSLDQCKDWNDVLRTQARACDRGLGR